MSSKRDNDTFGEILSRIVNIECPVCLEPFLKIVPLVLLCGHTACAKCLNELKKLSTTEAEPRLIVKCPICQQTTNLYKLEENSNSSNDIKKDVSKILPKNFVLLHLLEDMALFVPKIDAYEKSFVSEKEIFKSFTQLTTTTVPKRFMKKRFWLISSIAILAMAPVGYVVYSSNK